MVVPTAQRGLNLLQHRQSPLVAVTVIDVTVVAVSVVRVLTVGRVPAVAVPVVSSRNTCGAFNTSASGNSWRPSSAPCRSGVSECVLWIMMMVLLLVQLLMVILIIFSLVLEHIFMERKGPPPTTGTRGVRLCMLRPARSTGQLLVGADDFQQTPHVLARLAMGFAQLRNM